MILDIFLCVPSFYFITNKLENLTIGQYLAVEEKILFFRIIYFFNYYYHPVYAKYEIIAKFLI